MAITRLNSLAIPVGTVEPADISYPLTNFASTGIDDNATSTAITIDANEHVGIGVPPLGTLSVEGQGRIVTIGDSGTTNVPEIKSTNAAGTGEAFLKMSAYEHRVYTGGQRRVTINNNGKVGIGVSSPGALLHVNVTEESTGETDPIARFERLTTGDNHYLDITLDNSTNMVGFQSTGTSDGGFTFGGASSDLVTITSAGEVTVSKIISSTSANIAAAFTSTTTTAKLTITDANDTAFIDVNATRLGIGHASSTSLQALQIEPTSAEAMRIDSGGNVSIGTSSVSPIISSSKTLQLNSSGNTTLSIRSIDSVNDRSAILELLSSGNGVSKSIILYGDTDTSPGTASPLVFQKYHSGARAEVARFTATGNFRLGDSTPAFVDIKSGIGTNNGGMRWRFNSDSSVYGSLSLPYDTRATTGLHLYSGYPITYTVPGNKAHQFVTGGSEAARIDANGIKFNGDTAAANGLDDYEEGNWTPNSTTRSGAFTIYSARYTRVGQTVTVHGYFDWVANNQNNNSNQQFFGGLPFDLAASGHYTAGVVGYSGGVDISDWYLVALPNTDNFYFTKKTTAANVTNAEMHSKGLRILIVTITYITDE